MFAKIHPPDQFLLQCQKCSPTAHPSSRLAASSTASTDSQVTHHLLNFRDESLALCPPGISSNIQRLRVAFDEDRLPDLYEDRLVLQDIHSVSSLLKMYFRELPNPVKYIPPRPDMSCIFCHQVCTFHLYDKFVEAARSGDDVRFAKIREVNLKQPPPNYRFFYTESSSHNPRQGIVMPTAKYRGLANFLLDDPESFLSSLFFPSPQMAAACCYSMLLFAISRSLRCRHPLPDSHPLQHST